MFQFTRPQGARQGIYINNELDKGFNSRAHKGRDFRLFAPSRRNSCFNSRAHKGRDLTSSIFLE